MFGGTRNWPATLLPASYKGTVFFVDEEALPKSGRFVATHSFVKAEQHSTEDMGRVPREFRVAAYFASDTADSDAQAFVELCSEPGPGTLVLPMLGAVQARCRNCHVKSKTRDRQGCIEVELDFIEAGTADQAQPAAAIGDRLATASAAQIAATAQTLLNALDETERQDANTRRLDPLSAINADAAAPATTNYQGTRADQAARDSLFAQLYPLAQP